MDNHNIKSNMKNAGIYELEFLKRSTENWLAFLRSASNHYSRTFLEQLLIVAQFPNATAVMEKEVWLKNGYKMNYNQKSIPVFSVDFNGNFYDDISISQSAVKFYYDISQVHQTTEVRISRWEHNPENNAEILNAIQSDYSNTDTASFPLAVITALDNAVDEQNVSLKNFIVNSATYQILHRCGYPVDSIFDKTDFIIPDEFQDNQKLIDIAETVAKHSKNVLKLIAKISRKNYNSNSNEHHKEVKDYGNDISRERRLEQGRTVDNIRRLHDERGRNTDTGIRDGIRRSNDGQVRKNAPEMAAGGTPGTLHQSDVTGGHSEVSERDRRTGRKNDGRLGGETEETVRRDGGLESQRPYEMGRNGEQHNPLIGGSSSQRDSLPLNHSDENVKAEVQQQIVETSAFVISQEDIDSVLQSGSNVQEGKFRIYRQFSKNETPKENENFLKNEYGIGGFPVIGSDIYEQHNSTGITITKSHNSTIHLSWQQAAKRIGQLINADRYLNSKEKAQYPQWQVNQTITTEIPPTQETTQSVYSFSVGDKVFLGADDYQIDYIDDITVKLHDLKFPIFEKEFSRSEFETKIRENPLNEHLKVALNTDVSERNNPVQYTREQYYSFIGKTITYDLRKYVVDDIDIDNNNATIRDDNTGWYPLFQNIPLDSLISQNTELLLTDDERIFRDCDLLKLLSKYTLAWDEIESLGYIFNDSGYIDKYQPSEKSIFGNGLSEPNAYQMAKRYQNGEDISKELSENLFGQSSNIFLYTGQNAKYIDLSITNTETGYAVHCGSLTRQITYEEMANAYLDHFRNDYNAHFTFTDEEVANDTEIIVSDISESVKHSEEDTEKTEITPEDIALLQTIEPRKSVLNFSPEELEMTAKWKQHFESDIKEKSPFFRAENGEWRDKEQTLSPIIIIKNMHKDFKSVRDDIKSKTVFRGKVTNLDTNWDIQISRKGLEDSVKYAFKHQDNNVYNVLYNLPAIIANSILLDSTISEKNNNTKAFNTAFMHKLYILCKTDNETFLVKTTIEEFFDGENDMLHRMYNVQDIKIKPLRHIKFTDNQLARSVLSGNDVSVSDLFKIVKLFDQKFYLNQNHYQIQESDTKKVSAGHVSFTENQPHLKVPEVSVSDISESVKHSEEDTEKTELSRLATFTDSQLAFSVPDNSDVSLTDLPENVNGKHFDENADKFFFTEYGIEEIYFNPDSSAGGQFVINQLLNEDIIQTAGETTEKDKFFMLLDSIADQTAIDITDENFSGYIDRFNEQCDLEGNSEETMDKLIVRAKKMLGISDDVVQQNPPNVNSENYRITDIVPEHRKPLDKFNDNLAVIRILKQLETENRTATPTEQEQLAKYVGWGGLSKYLENESNLEELSRFLNPVEIQSIKESTLTAFYTPPVVIKAMYQCLENLGFKTGNILEPSCGTGNFMGLIPESMSASKFYGIELDSITGQIAKNLYPQNNITVGGYENQNLPDSFFDVAIGNIPFGNFQLHDKRYNKYNFLIHDYFFAKTLDKVRPGGIIAFVTSKGTLDKKDNRVRKYISERATLLGAIRLPNNTFGDTKATSDIIFLQKKDGLTVDNPDWLYLKENQDGIVINQYFADNPDMVLGNLQLVSGQYGQEVACLPNDSKEPLAEQLFYAVEKIKGQITQVENFDTDMDYQESIPANPNVRNFSYTIVDGKLYFRQDSVMLPQKNISDKSLQCVKDLIKLRDTLRELIEYQLENYPDDDIVSKRNELNALYDRFTNQHGILNSRTVRRLFKEDSSYPLLSSLEVLDDKGNLKGKSDIMFKRTIKPSETISHCQTSSEALIVSLNEKGKPDLAFISQLTGFDKEKILSDLKGTLYRIPHTDEYQTADEYLSGNVREKLFIAENAVTGDESYRDNVNALKEVQPRDLTAGEVKVILGATWISPEYINDFIDEIFQPSYYSSIRVSYSETTGRWYIGNKSKSHSVLIDNVYGTEDINAYHLLEQALNFKKVKIYDTQTDSEGNKIRVYNHKKTTLAEQKQESIKSKFEEWIFKDATRRTALLRKYNDTFNCIRNRTYDGSHLTLPNTNPEKTYSIYGNAPLTNAVHSLFSATFPLRQPIKVNSVFMMTSEIN